MDGYNVRIMYTDNNIVNHSIAIKANKREEESMYFTEINSRFALFPITAF